MRRRNPRQVMADARLSSRRSPEHEVLSCDVLSPEHKPSQIAALQLQRCSKNKHRTNLFALFCKKKKKQKKQRCVKNRMRGHVGWFTLSATCRNKMK